MAFPRFWQYACPMMLGPPAGPQRPRIMRRKRPPAAESRLLTVTSRFLLLLVSGCSYAADHYEPAPSTPASACQPQLEVCDGKDNDCDSLVDEGFESSGFNLGDPCVVGVGACKAPGVVVCSDDERGTRCSATANEPAVELCDGPFVDEDCDGQANEDCSCAPGNSPDLPCGLNTGDCTPGVQRCLDGRYGPCEGASQPSSEVCDGRDNDCNGRIDDLETTGQECSRGVGACRRVGILRCQGSGGEPSCDVAPDPPSQERCNGIDDDCNGATDDLTGPCGSDIGECVVGAPKCVDGNEVCVDEIAPTLERCDGKDNDCDGQTDEDFAAELGHPCSSGVGACRRDGVTACDEFGLATRCGAEPGEPVAESCNGLDDNCDGLVDFPSPDGSAVSACECAPVVMRPTRARRNPAERVGDPSTCALGIAGEGQMQIYMGNLVGGWAQCVFEPVSLQRFDADWANTGALEVRFCLDNFSLHAELSLQYGSPPRAKRFAWQQSQGFPSGCHVRYLRPSDAECLQTSGAPTDLPDACMHGCTQGKWSAHGESCRFPYDGVPVSLTTTNTSSYPYNHGKITMTATFFPGACVCLRNADCRDPDRPVCDLSAALSDSRCAPGTRCAGLCVP